MKRLAVVLVASLWIGCGASTGGGDDGGAIDGTPATPDATPAPDAVPTPFGCLGKPLPTHGPATIHVSGTTDTINGTTPTPTGGITVAAYVNGSSSATASTTSASDGSYALDLSTSGAPLDGYLKGSLQGNEDLYLYPPRPLTADINNATVLSVTSSQIDFVAALAGTNQSSSKGFLVVVVADCLFNPLANATVTLSPSTGATVVYMNNGQPDSNATATDTSGVALVFDAPTGTDTVGATVDGMTLRAHPVGSHAGAVSATAVQP